MAFKRIDTVFGMFLHCIIYVNCKIFENGNTNESRIMAITVDPCDEYPCQNGGRCVTIYGNTRCICKLGFTGKLCGADSCSPNPCQNGGYCLVEGTAFNCMCEERFSGDTCENDPCSPNPCHNGGSCLVEGKKFKCLCKERYSGTNCENGSTSYF